MKSPSGIPFERVLVAPAFWAILALVASILLSWPFLAPAAFDSLRAIFGFIFVTWAFFIAVLWLIARSLAKRRRSGV